MSASAPPFVSSAVRVPARPSYSPRVSTSSRRGYDPSRTRSAAVTPWPALRARPLVSPGRPVHVHPDVLGTACLRLHTRRMSGRDARCPWLRSGSAPIAVLECARSGPALLAPSTPAPAIFRTFHVFGRVAHRYRALALPPSGRVVPSLSGMDSAAALRIAMTRRRSIPAPTLCTLRGGGLDARKPPMTTAPVRGRFPVVPPALRPVIMLPALRMSMFNLHDPLLNVMYHHCPLALSLAPSSRRYTQVRVPKACGTGRGIVWFRCVCGSLSTSEI
ncbi:hypothetical protein DFH07DRAFT_1008697 [Mycena maculata]|uniref:Uncharacterized protein n=1 Tax=Mycena maculata TaxID=230809 RepID=A0AAD7JN16_9AGAR|nr:hypothetical protein DFH07DRAFT_1008697 [Mycena maculata]